MTATFTTKDRDLIRSLLEQGVELSAERIGAFTKMEWDIVTASVDEVPVIQALSRFHGDPAPHFGAHLQGRSILPVEVVVLFPEPSARTLTEGVLRGGVPGLAKLPNPQAAVIAEVSNLMGQAVLKALADSLQVAMVLGVPKLSNGLKSEILGRAFENFDGAKDAVLLSRLDMTAGATMVQCTIAMIFRVRLMRQLIRARKDD